MSSGDRRLRVELLGEVRARADGRDLVLGSPRQRAVLAMLAVRVGGTVARAELIDGVWGDAAPASVEGSVYTYVHGLRRALSAAGEKVLIRSAAGYRLLLAPSQVDLSVAEAQVEKAREVATSGHQSAAADILAECLAQWRGSPLHGIPGPFAAAERTRLTEWRFELIEERADLMLAADRHREVIAELVEAAEEEPFRERLRAQLMLALYRSGQRADALAEFDNARLLLTDQLGLDPSAELTDLHLRMLRSDPALDLAPEPHVRAHSLTPAQMPHAVPDFVGRVRELQQLDEWRRTGATDGRPLVISAIDGAGGIGKTSLAVRYARQLTDSCPDGQLYLDLRGFDPKRPPLTTTEALSQLLWSLGCTRQPTNLEMQKSTYRALLSSKQVLILLDNAVSPEQVRDLLPGPSKNLLLVTSRNRLTGLVTQDGARRLTLGLLTETESLDLLRRVIGQQRVDAEPEHAAVLARLCGYLPLALRVAAEKASSGPRSSLRELVENLTEEKDRLDALHTDDEMSSVRTVISWSYASLPGPAARAFRYLGLLNTADIGVAAVAALIDRPAHETEEMLSTLCDLHLLDSTGSSFKSHDLVRLYASELAVRTENPEERSEAIRRLLAWYLYSVRSALLCTIPDYPIFPASVPEPRHTLQQFDTRESAYAWYEAEASNIAALTRRAAELGEHEVAWQLPWCMHDHYYSTGQLTEWLELLRVGLSSAEQLPSPEPQARLLNDLGIASSRIGRNDLAVRHLQRGIGIARKMNQPDILLRLLTNLASTLREMKSYDEGIVYGQEAWRLAVELGRPYEIAGTLDTLCELYVESNQPKQALECGKAGLDAARASQIGLPEANLLVNVAHAHRDLGDTAAATRRYETALELCAKLRDRYHEALALLGLAELHRRMSRYSDSREHAQRALSIFVSLDGEETDTAREFIAKLDAETRSDTS
ncbi:DNA-binding transcriptional activator of the SARP family [Amycolatopsis lurida]|uniref:Transcriptional regulator, SARP family protein n=1 Tax=Amycolatopsis lurida NRRL 2430 TaxID=1460371 RepID=A0A2P2FF63_AMYLU|nr:AfsR/SARP family transcriptional regulator [Amycolatopsis lurida]KFU75360.1 transcriptional regulator, SARP family protein [Amycolatopsis lurida NRRL 2430]SEE32352.1 DNA-binding transcriptional activator of the SARP family [Amycolatopsis lurida]